MLIIEAVQRRHKRWN